MEHHYILNFDGKVEATIETRKNLDDTPRKAKKRYFIHRDENLEEISEKAFFLYKKPYKEWKNLSYSKHILKLKLPNIESMNFYEALCSACLLTNDTSC